MDGTKAVEIVESGGGSGSDGATKSRWSWWGRPCQLMYPKVKVRDQDNDDQQAWHDHNRSSSVFLKEFQSLSIFDSCFSVKEHQGVSLPLVERIAKVYVSNVIMPKTKTSPSEGAENNNKKFDEEIKQNIRASPIPRPRAVLSSPDNDEVIGHNNRISRERPSALKNHNQIQNRHSQYKCKVITSHVNTDCQHSGKSKDSNVKSELSGNKRLAKTVSSGHKNPRAVRPSSLRS